MRLVFVLSALAALVLAPAAAQSPNRPPPPPRPPAAPPPAPSPGAPAPEVPAPPNAAAPEARPHTGTLVPSPHQAQSDQVFIAQALRSGQGEMDLASLAEQRAGSEPVREFAQQMVRDLGQTHNALNRLTEGAPAPDRPDADHRGIHDVLSNLSGPEFDIEYLRLQMQARQRMAQLMQYEIGSGTDVQVQRVASDALPRVFAQLDTTRQLLEQVSTQNPQAAAAPPRKASGMPTRQTPRATLN
jgi:putative membrane protein